MWLNKNRDETIEEGVLLEQNKIMQSWSGVNHFSNP